MIATLPAPLPAARDYPGLRKALAARRKELGWSQRELDDITGLQEGYVSKLECGDRCFGPLSLALTLQALGVEILLRPIADT